MYADVGKGNFGGADGLQAQGQALLQEKGHSYDVMKAKDKKSGEAVTLYFNADIPFKSYEVKLK